MLVERKFSRFAVHHPEHASKARIKKFRGLLMRYDYVNKEKLSEAEHEEDGRALTSSHLMNFSPSWSAFETSTEPARTATVDTLGELRGLCWVDLGALSGRVDVRAAAVAVVSADAAISRFNLHLNEFYFFNT